MNGERHRQYSWSSKRKAQQALSKYLKKLSEGETHINPLFSEVVDKYLNTISKSINKNTLYTKQRVTSKFITPYFEKYRIKTIKVKHINNFLDVLLDLTYEDQDGDMVPYSNDYLGKIQTELWAIFEYATIHGYITLNPTLRVNKVRHNTVQKSKEFYRVPRELSLKAAQHGADEKIRLMLMLARDHGLRPSEISGLDIKDINVNNRTVHIRQAWKSKDKELTPPKNGKDRINATTDEVLNAYRELLNYYESSGGYHDNMPLFSLNGREAKTTMDRWKNKAIKEADVPHFSWYDLRHTHVTDLLELGFKPYQVAERMGHTEVQTLDYAIVDIDEQFDMVKALNSDESQGLKRDQTTSKEEIMSEINRLLELLKD